MSWKPVQALLLCATALALWSNLASATPLGANIVVDGGAEAATGTAIPGWTTTSSFEAVSYGTGGGFPTSDVSSAIGGGTYFFAGGQDTAFSSAVQTIAIGDLAASIDAGAVTATLSADLGGFSTQPDYMTLTLAFLNGAATQLGTFTIGPATAGDRAGNTTLLARTGSIAIPVSTRSLRLELDATRFEGSYDDGYADNVSLVLSSRATPPATVPEPGALPLLLAGLTALGLGRLVMRRSDDRYPAGNVTL